MGAVRAIVRPCSGTMTRACVHSVGKESNMFALGVVALLAASPLTLASVQDGNALTCATVDRTQRPRSCA